MPVIKISNFCIPDELNVERRIAPPKVRVLNDEFWFGYDQKTLFYDVYYDCTVGKIYIFCPKLLNFELMIGSLDFKVDGNSVNKLNIKRYKKFDIIYFDSKNGSELSFEIKGFTYFVPIQKNISELFEDKKVLCAITKNNKIHWIVDWMIHHNLHHGANAVLLFDNGSDSYSVDDLDYHLSKVPGYDNVSIVSVPLPYGPLPKTANGLGRAKFLQSSLLNLAKMRFFQKAKGVLSVDIDELVVTKNGVNVFEQLSKSFFGFVAFKGEWRFSLIDPDKVSHKDHIYYSGDFGSCPPKYCYNPNGVFGKFTLGIHSFEFLSHKFIPISRSINYLHFRSISTSWKNKRENPPNIFKISCNFNDLL